MESQTIDWSKPLETVGGVKVAKVDFDAEGNAAVTLVGATYSLNHDAFSGECFGLPEKNLRNVPEEAETDEAEEDFSRRWEEALAGVEYAPAPGIVGTSPDLVVVDEVAAATPFRYDLDMLLGLHEEICQNSRDIMEAKNHDYTNGSDSVFANFEGSRFLGVHPVLGILMRTMDKFKRIETFVTQGKLAVKGESVADAVSDSINYLVLIHAFIRQEVANSQ